MNRKKREGKRRREKKRNATHPPALFSVLWEEKEKKESSKENKKTPWRLTCFSQPDSQICFSKKKRQSLLPFPLLRDNALLAPLLRLMKTSSDFRSSCIRKTSSSAHRHYASEPGCTRPFFACTCRTGIPLRLPFQLVRPWPGSCSPG